MILPLLTHFFTLRETLIFGSGVAFCSNWKTKEKSRILSLTPELTPRVILHWNDKKTLIRYRKIFKNESGSGNERRFL